MNVTHIRHWGADIAVIQDRTVAVIVRCQLCFDTMVETDTWRTRICRKCYAERRQAPAIPASDDAVAKGA